MTGMSDSHTQSLPRLFVIGDSLSVHYGPSLEQALAGVMAYDRKRPLDGKTAEANLDIAEGANGGDSQRVLAYLRFRREKDPIRADILLINCGLHDIKTDPATGARQVPPEQYEANLRQIVEEAAAVNLQLVWLRTAPVIDELHNTRAAFHRFEADVEAYNRIADAVMRQAGVHVIDFHAFCRTLLPEGLIDHVHYDEAARARQGKFIAEALRMWKGI